MYWKQWNNKAKKRCREDYQYFRQVAGKDINDKFFNVLVNTPSFTNGFYNGGKIIIQQDHIRCFFRYIGAGYTHCNSYISLFKCWCIIYAIPCHSYKLAVVL